MDGKQNQKLIILSVVIILVISTSGFYIWYTHYRNWSIEELDSKALKDTNPQENVYPTIKSDMAGEEITVEGEITSLDSISSNQGTFTTIELDGHANLRLTEEGNFEHDVGDHVTLDVEFKEGYFNGEKHVFSPQLHPELSALGIQTVNSEVNNVSGLGFTQDNTSEQIQITVEEYKEDDNDILPLELNEAKIGLYSGKSNLPEDYRMTGEENVDDFEDQRMIDFGELSDEKEKEGITFYDNNDNGKFDIEDHFEIDLDNFDKPDQSLALNTYHLIIKGDTNGSQNHTWTSYIIMNEDGFLKSGSH